MHALRLGLLASCWNQVSWMAGAGRCVAPQAVNTAAYIHEEHDEHEHIWQDCATGHKGRAARGIGGSASAVQQV